MVTLGLVILLGIAWMVLESRIAMGEETPWPWQDQVKKPPF